MHPIAKRQHLEVLMGFLGVFVFFGFVNAAIPLLQGSTAVVPSLILLLLVLLFYSTYRSWRRLG